MIYQNREENLFVKVTDNNSYLAHMHRQVEIFYVLDGAIEVTVSGQKKLLEKGMVSVAFPNVVHESHTPAQSQAVMIIFSTDFLPDFSAEFHTQRPRNPFIDKLSEPERFSALVSGLLESVQKNTDTRIAKGYLYILAAMILSQTPLIRQESTSGGICQDISNYLSRHFTEEISLSQLADALGYSKYHISHIFKESFGCSYSDYLRQIRSEHAMGLLTHSSLSMTDICFSSGFSSMRSFYRAFSAVYGTAPGAVR